MEAYPDKLRELVLDCYDEGLGTAEIARRFKVSCDWVRRVRRRWLEDEVSNGHQAEARARSADGRSPSCGADAAG